jgi:hypothetical protein
MAEPATAERARQPLHPVVSGALTGAACVLVWLALVVPHDPGHLTPARFARIPVEGVVLAALALVLRPRGRRAAAIGFGLVLGLLVILKAADVGFLVVMDRPVDPLNDWFYVGPGIGVLGNSIGQGGAVVVAVGASLVVVAVLTIMPLAVVEVMRLIAVHRRRSVRVVAALASLWVLFAVSGLQSAPGTRIASTSSTGLVYHLVGQLRDDLQDRQAFAEQIREDRFDGTPDDRLLTALRGRDVILAFVESYGRVAVQGTTFSPGVRAVLDAGTRRLRAVGFSARSAFLTSPTFGAASWLAHATLQSGLWVDSQQRYNQLITQDRLTLTDAFRRAGWRTVGDVPANTKDWPEGASFYGFEQLYDSRNVGYRGPEFGYASMPDQFTLAALRRLELADPARPDVMAEVDLVSSHHPWAPLPRMIDWADLGDGSTFIGMPEQGESADEVFRDPDRVREAYGKSIEYTLSALVSFVETYPDPDLVLVLVGDHQPHTYVTGADPSHEVPVTIVTHDPSVLARTAAWGWQDGMRPDPDAPVWRMDEFRDRFLTAFGPG